LEVEMGVEPRFKREKNFAVISMADIVLLLLIFFLLTSSYIVQPGLRVRLPRATTKEAVSEDRVIITITKEGGVYIGEKAVTLTQIPYLIEENKDRIVLIKADREVSIAMAVKVMDAVKRGGGTRIVIATTPEE